MRIGYNQPLYLLPFDHRRSYLADMFHFTGVLTADEREMVTATKRLIYEGFKQALHRTVSVASAGILVDEEFGAGILRDATRHGYVTALSTEKSGSNEFFERAHAHAGAS
jgi:myo-inositol catabolism protein IolC